MKTTNQAIESVASARYSRMCLTQPEPVASANTVDFLTHMQDVHKSNPPVLHFVAALKSAYSKEI